MRIFEQLSSFIRQARSTSIFVLNLSDLKPAVLSAAAALAFVWDPSPYVVNSSVDGVPNRSATKRKKRRTKFALDIGELTFVKLIRTVYEENIEGYLKDAKKVTSIEPLSLARWRLLIRKESGSVLTNRAA